MHDESVNRDRERAFAAFLDHLVTGEPGDAGVDPALAETARDLHDRAAHSTVSAPPAGTLAAIRADLFGEPATRGSHRATLGLVPGSSILSQPLAQVALAAAVLLALVTGFATFRSDGWLTHGPTSTHGALAASSTAPITTELAMSPDNSAIANRATVESGFITPDPATCTAAPRAVEEIQTIDASKSGSESSQPLAMSTTSAGAMGSGSSSDNRLGSRSPSVPTPTPIYLSKLPAGTPADAATIRKVSDTVGEIYGCLQADKRLQVYALFTDDGLARFPAPSLLFSPGILEGPGDRTAFKIASASILPDGRVVAKIAFQVSEGIYNETWIFAPANNGYLVEQMNPTETPPSTAAPLAVTHASLPATPAASPTPTLTSEAQSLVQTCPMSTGTVIQGAAQPILGWGLGTAPLWINGWGNPPAQIQGRYPHATIQYMSEPFAGPTQLGWFTPADFVMNQTNTASVTVRGHRVSDGALILFDVTYGHPAATVTLDPAHPNIPVQHANFREWLSDIYFPGSGCYEIAATWEGGSWTAHIPVIVPTAPSQCSAAVTSGATPQAVYPGTPADFTAPTPRVLKPGENPCAPPAGSPTPMAETPAPATPIASSGAATPSANTSCSMPDAKAINLPIGSDGQYIKDAWGLGTSPLWLVGLGKTPDWYHPTDPGFPVTPDINVGGTPTPPAGTIDHVLWLMPADNLAAVTVTGRNVLTGQRLVFKTLDASLRSNETTTAVFNPAADPAVTRFGAARLWWTGIIYPQPGCYEITATWASGSWTIRLPLPPPTTVATPTACATPVRPGTPPMTTHILNQAPPPFATRQPPIPYITPGVQQIITPPGIPLITPTPFATIIGVATPGGTPESGCR